MSAGETYAHTEALCFKLKFVFPCIKTSKTSNSLCLTMNTAGENSIGTKSNMNITRLK